MVQGGDKGGQMVWVEVTQIKLGEKREVRMNMRNKFPPEVAKSNLDAFTLTLERLSALRWQIYHPSFPGFLTS